MPVAEKITGGEVYLRGIDQRVTAGDRVDVSDAFAAYLREERGDFRIVDVQDADYREVDDATDDQDESEEFDAAAFVDRTPMDDVIDDIHSGDVDEHLDAIGEAADRVGIDDAVGERRAELEE